MRPEERLHRYLIGAATSKEVAELDTLLATDASLRKHLITEASIDAELRAVAMERVSEEGEHMRMEKGSLRTLPLMPMAMAAGLAFLLGLALMHVSDRSDTGNVIESDVRTAEPSAEGFAVLSHLDQARWPASAEKRTGDLLGSETLRMEAGMAELQFFSGATMVVQGPAEISLQSAWEAHCHEGTVRMQVPPAARGFTLHGPSTEIVDHGTEFGLEVREGQALVEVIDGEIAFRHRDAPERMVRGGSAWGLPEDGEATRIETDATRFPSMRANEDWHQRQDFERWRAHRDRLAKDPRVIAYYTFERDSGKPFIPSEVEPRDEERDGAVVLAESAAGRWPGLKGALEFRRPGSRVRVHLPGDFQAFTFAAWVRVDSLDRRYNALFMGDGYETGEPHWQIRDDGKLMLSVMVDDANPHPTFPEVRYHHVYFSPPIWELSMSGQWLHLASVFDTRGRAVSHYVDGKRVSRETIKPDFLIESLRIGNGEIGNWGQPFRETSWFAIRNLNGCLDELVILNAALTDSEIHLLHQRSRADAL